MTDIAFAAGFGSIRQFNETFRRLYGTPPGSLRRATANQGHDGPDRTNGVEVRLRYRAPYDWTAMLTSLSRDLIPGVECIADGAYQRTLVHGGAAGRIQIRHASAKGAVIATIWHPDVRILPVVVTRIRRVFDLASDPKIIADHLARDPLLAPVLKSHPGLRVPGRWEGFETAVRVVLGWDVSEEFDRSRRRDMATLGDLFADVTHAAAPGLTRLFPTPSQIANADYSALPRLEHCAATLRGIAQAALNDPSLFETILHPADRARRLQEAPGLSGELGKRIAGAIDVEPDQVDAPGLPGLPEMMTGVGLNMEHAAFEERASTWRPWRAYALNYAALAQTRD